MRLFAFFSDYINESPDFIHRRSSMKKIYCILCVFFLLTSVLLTSCIKSPWKDQVIEEALIEKISPKIIHIQTTNPDGTLQHYNINICDDVAWQGNKIALSDLQVGDRIRVTYDGAVIEIYPALIEGTTKIELLEEAVSEPTENLIALVEKIDGARFTLINWDTLDESMRKAFVLEITPAMHIVKKHLPVDPSALSPGNIISITYRGTLTDDPEIIRIETLERIDLTEE